jgi:ribosomal protein S18 acetylase RimI-like enzyme
MRLGQIGVRRAGRADAAPIAAVHDEAWRLAYRGIIPGRELERMISRRGPTWWTRAIDRRTSILVIDVGGEIAGYATFGANRMRMLPYAGEIYEIYLKPSHQGLGFGGHLFAAVRRELGRYGLSSFAIRVLADNAVARGFYEHFGGIVAAETGEKIGDATLPIVVYGFAPPSS